MFVYYIFTHTKESYENSRGVTISNAIIESRDDEGSHIPNSSFYRHTISNFVANLPRSVREFGKIDGKDNSVTLDFQYAQQNHPTYYKLGVFDNLRDKSERYFNDERFREIQSKIKYMNAGFAWMQRHKYAIYNRLREKFSS